MSATNKSALADIRAALQQYPLVMLLGWQDLRQRYRRSSLGAFWLTLSMGMMIGTIGLVFGQIFNTPIDVYLPFLSVGMIFWGLMTSVITESCVGFTAAEAIIKQLPIPLFVHILRVLWRNLLILAHNIAILPIVFLVFGKPLTLAALLFLPGLLIVLLNLLWVSLLLGVVCTRYRDLPQIVSNLLMVLFYVTPVMWTPESLPRSAGRYLLDANPAYHLLEVVRAPLLGTAPALASWAFSLALTVVGWGLTIWVYGRYRKRIPYWL
jgi:lipopolysaccharide transport system permease protein